MCRKAACKMVVLIYNHVNYGTTEVLNINIKFKT